MRSGPNSASFSDLIRRFALKCPRFWVPRGCTPELSDRGFLPDTGSFLAAGGHVPFDAIAELPALALLGEPGMGKSSVLTQQAGKLQAAIQETGDYFLHVDLSAYGTDLLIIKDIFESRKFGAWKDGNTRLHLLLDGFDTCLPRIENLVDLLLTHFAKAPRERLLLRIACRTANWPADMEQGLRTLWGDEDLGIYELAPLRRRDAATAAVAVGCDPDQFLADVDRLAASQFANRPLTLGFLLKSRVVGNPMPEHRADLYREGCRLLCDEWREDRRRSRHRHGLSSGQRFAVARSLAAISIFCQKTAIWTGPLREVALAHDIRVDELLGNEEQFNREVIVVTKQALQETLDTGLFRTLGPHRIAFAHQTYAEFLAADHLLAHDVPATQVLGLVLQSDQRGRVVPQLRETAVWLASMVSDVFKELLRKDPATLFASDTPPIAPADRRAVILQTLRLFEEGKLHDLRLVTEAIARLKYDGIAEDLEPYIRDDSKSENARRAAVLIARYTKQVALQDALVRSAVDEDGPPRLRIAAARAVREIGEPSAKAALKPLVTISAERDPDDELKGNALIATWPEHLTADGLFAALTSPQRPNFIGAYREFLSSDFGTGVAPPDRPKALQWAKTHIKRSARTDPLGIAALQLVTVAIDWVVPDSELCDPLASLLTEIATLPLPNLRLIQKFNRRPDTRSLLAHSAIRHCADDHTAVSLLSYGLVEAEDLTYLLEELERGPSNDLEEKLAVLIALIVPRLASFDTPLMERVFEAANRNTVLRDELRPALYVELASSKAEFLKASHFAESQGGQAPEPEPPKVDISDLLTAVEQGRPSAFPEICFRLAGLSADPDEDEALPGWNELAASVQEQLLRAARLFLELYRPDDSWIESTPWRADALYGYWALRVLAAQSPQDLGNLPGELWSAWMPSAFGNAYVGEAPDELQTKILEAAYRADALRFRDLLSRFIDSQSTREQEIAVLHIIAPLWDAEMAAILRTKLRDGELAPRAFRSILAILLAAGDREAATIAAEVINSAATKNQKAIEAALGWLENDPPGAWANIWPILDGNYEFAQCVFSQFARDPFSLGGQTVLKELQEQQLAQWLIWLAHKIDESLEVAEKEEHPRTGLITSMNTLGGWQSLRAEVMNELIRRGTPAAVAAIQYIDEAAPDVSLKRIAEMAQDFVWQKTWKPLSPHEFLEFVTGSDRPAVSLPEVRTDQGNGKRGDQPAEAGFDKGPKCRFQRIGDSWFVQFGDAAFSVKHSIGMAYIAHLLRSPGRSFSCMELYSAEHTCASQVRKMDEQDKASLIEARFGADEILDNKARDDYRDRLEFIDKELRACEGNNDIGRKERLSVEKERLISELKVKMDRRGRARRFSTDSEKSRKAVSAAIRTALHNIERTHQDMAEYLKQHLELGNACRYDVAASIGISDD